MDKSIFYLGIFALLCLSTSAVKRGDDIKIYVNKVGPYSNPIETYRYYDLPYCQPLQVIEQDMTLKEKLSGNRKTNSLYNVKFPVHVKAQEICQKKLDQNELNQFLKAIEENWYFEMYLENFSIGAPVGRIQSLGEKYEKKFLANHLIFTIWYNSGLQKIIGASVNFDEEDTIELSNKRAPVDISFYYTIEFRETIFDSDYIDKGIDTLFSGDVSLWPIFNLIIVTGLLSFAAYIVIMKLSKDNSQMHIHDSEAHDRDEMISKKSRYNVFRIPDNIMVLSSIIGSGTQLIAFGFIFILLGAMSFYYSAKGSGTLIASIIYPLMSVIAAFISFRLYNYLGGTDQWVSSILLSIGLFPVPLFTLFFLLNIFAWLMNTTSTIPFSAIITILIIWIFIAIPSTIFGGFLAKTYNDDKVIQDVDSKEKKISRNLDNLPIYLRPPVLIGIAGLIPFMTATNQFNYIFNGIWNHKIFNAWGELFFTFACLITIIGCITVIMIYLQFNSGDYQWWWRSVYYGGSLGIYVFLYSIYYYHQSGMNNFLQTIYYFGFNLVFSFGAFLIFGTISFISAYSYIHNIYDNEKVA